MKRIIVILLLLSSSVFAQSPGLNCNRVGYLPYSERLSSIWGYNAPNGKEYALVGAYSGASIVDISNPATPSEVVFIPGGQTIWRELKTWDKYMYVVSEQVNEGLLIADLSTITSGISYNYKLLPVGNDTVRNAHTLYIDENGYLYLAGTNLFNGAPMIFDLNPDPQNPVYLGVAGNVYAHDMYVRGDTLWGAHIIAGYFSAYDISNKTSPQLLNIQNTGFNFTHNVWLSDNSNYLFSTDERAGAYVESYDVSDLTDIRLLDRWKVSADNLPIPHNVHVINDYVITSYYTEGIVVLDGKHPNNLVLTNQYDTYLPFGNGFLGCWGVYPYFSSGLIVASDINTGLHVIQANYQRACRIEGVVTNSADGNPLFDVMVDIVNNPISDNTLLDGNYKTGIHTAGNYQVRFRKEGFTPQTFNVYFVHDSIIRLDVALSAAIPFVVSGNVFELSNSTQGVADAKVKFLHSANFYEIDTFCNTFGAYNLSVQEEEYYVIAGKWGYMTADSLVYISNATAPDMQIDSAIYDDFVFDFGWTITGNINNGKWERVVPGTQYQWSGMMPNKDILNDFGSYCYVTGNNDSRSDSGITSITSPIFDALNYDDPHMSFYYWLTCFDSTYVNISDSLSVVLNNGSSSAVVISYRNGLYNWSGLQVYRLADYLPLSNQMSVSFIVNNSNARNFTEAAIDRFRVDEYEVLTTIDRTIVKEEPDFMVFPNPFSETFVLKLNNSDLSTNSKISVHDISGRLIETHLNNNFIEQIQLGQNWNPGIYFISYKNKTQKVVKLK
jgi:choice-of-anchor B domain-containing protein